MNGTLTLIFGTNDVEFLKAGFIFALLGSVLNLLIESNKRDPNSTRTPPNFSFLFLFKDNVKRLLITVILIFIFMRFSQEIAHVKISLWVCFLIGFGSDLLSMYLKKVKTNFFKSKFTSTTTQVEVTPESITKTEHTVEVIKPKEENKNNTD